MNLEDHKQNGYYDLNVYVPPKFTCKILMCNVTVLEVGAFEGCFGYEGGTLTNGIRAL